MYLNFGFNNYLQEAVNIDNFLCLYKSRTKKRENFFNVT